MPEPDLGKLFVHPLDITGVNYLVAGSVASIHYGELRSTFDVNFVVSLAVREIPALMAAFPEEHYYVPPEEVIAAGLAHEAFGHFNILHPESGLKAGFHPVHENQMATWAFQNRRRARVFGLDAWLAPPEYVILWKLKYFQEGGSSKHISDIKGIIAVQGHALDRAWIAARAAEEHVLEEWRACLG